MVKSAGKGNCEERGNQGGQSSGGWDCRAGDRDVAVHHHDLVDHVHHAVDALHVRAGHVGAYPIPFGVILCGGHQRISLGGRAGAEGP